MKLQKVYLTYYNLLIVKDLWQAHHQLLSIISLKEFIELNLNTDTIMKNVKLVDKCFYCNKNYQNKFYEKLKERFFNTYKFSHHDKNKFILLLEKGVYLCEYMDDQKKFSETSLHEKEDFYRNLNLKDIADADYTHAKQNCKDFEINILGGNHYLYFQSNTLLLANVFENFRNACLEINDPK